MYSRVGSQSARRHADVGSLCASIREFVFVFIAFNWQKARLKLLRGFRLHCWRLFGGRSLRQAMTLFSGDRCEMLPRAASASAGGSIHPDERQCTTIALFHVFVSNLPYVDASIRLIDRESVTCREVCSAWTSLVGRRTELARLLHFDGRCLRGNVKHWHHVTRYVLPYGTKLGQKGPFNISKTKRPVLMRPVTTTKVVDRRLRARRVRVGVDHAVSKIRKYKRERAKGCNRIQQG